VSACPLTCAAPVQTRYTAVRRQTAPAKGAKETQVLDYQNVASDLLPTVAAAYALKFMGQVPCYLQHPLLCDHEFCVHMSGTCSCLSDKLQ
jgi:hypothetical protein